MSRIKIDKKIVGYAVNAAEESAADAPRPEFRRESTDGGAEIIRMHEKLERPEMLVGSTYKVKTPISDHAMYVTINDIILNEGTEFVAMADAYRHRLDEGLEAITKTASKKGPGKINVKESGKHVGLESYKDVIDSVDTVILTTPPGFRPMMFEYAVDKGLNVFMEKPLSPDGFSSRKLLEINKKAKAKGGHRVMFTSHHPCWDAKNRHDLATELPFDYAQVAHCFVHCTVVAAAIFTSLGQ